MLRQLPRIGICGACTILGTRLAGLAPGFFTDQVRNLLPISLLFLSFLPVGSAWCGVIYVVSWLLFGLHLAWRDGFFPSWIFWASLAGSLLLCLASSLRLGRKQGLAGLLFALCILYLAGWLLLSFGFDSGIPRVIWILLGLALYGLLGGQLFAARAGGLRKSAWWMIAPTSLLTLYNLAWLAAALETELRCGW